MPKDTSKTVTIRVRIADSEIEVTGPPDFVERKVREFLDQAPSPGRAPPSGQASRPRQLGISLKGSSPAQFLRKLNPKSDVDAVLGAGFFLERARNQDNFTAREVRTLLAEAKRRPPKNPNDAINSNIKKGLIMSAGNRENKIAFVLTSDGEEQIEEALSESRG